MRQSEPKADKTTAKNATTTWNMKNEDLSSGLSGSRRIKE
jgi:hypothetical protein